MKDQINIKFLNDCLLINNILIVGDIHIGYGTLFYEKSVASGLQLKEIIGKFNCIFKYLKKENIKIDKIIQLGDFKHDFNTITDVEWREILRLLDYFIKKVGNKNIIIIKGNHDNILKPILNKRKIKLFNFFKIKIGRRVLFFLHGDKLNRNYLNSDFLFLGHLHPSISLYDQYKKEIYKCFLQGIWKGKKVYILPSFNNVSYGFDLRNIKKNYWNKKLFIINNSYLKNFYVIIYNNKEKKEYNFGKLKKFI
jgi:putative SbcD/Mre11-related phosphoesterase